jgi:peptide/nickel transport system permease protein
MAPPPASASAVTTDVTGAARIPTLAEIVEPSPGVLLRRRILGHWGLIFGGGVLLFIIAVALLAPWLAPHDPLDQDLTNRVVLPVWYDKGTWLHPLGTDQFGRDYLSRLIYGSRISLLIGFAAMLISLFIGTTLGVAAGYFGGRVDMAVNFIITTRLSLPVVLVALAVVSLIGNSLWIVIWVLGFLLWDRFAVVMRSTTQQVRGLDYVAAAQATGCSTLRILLGEIMPNIAPAPSWGLMIAEAKGYMFFDAWLIGIPGTALFALVMAINLMGDGVRDVTAPEGRN